MAGEDKSLDQLHREFLIKALFSGGGFGSDVNVTNTLLPVELSAANLAALETITVANPTANPETGLAKETTLAALLTELGQKYEGGAIALDAPTLAALETISATITNFPATQNVSGTITLDAATLAALETIIVSGTVAVSNFPATQAVSGTVAVSNFPAPDELGLTDAQLRAAAVGVNDIYTDGEALADQNGAGAVLTFTFTSPVQLVFVRANGGIARAVANAQTPSATLGVYCGDGESTPIPRVATTVKVFAPAATTVSVWGFRY